MKRYVGLLALVVGMCAPLVGCGDDSGGSDAGGGKDGSTTQSCPPKAPEREQMMGACCYRESNEARLDAPELRLARVAIEAPPGLADPTVLGVLQAAFDEERFNWLVRIEGADADGDILVRTGFGRRAADSSFAFANGGAPGPGDANRWDPAEIGGTVTGEEFSAPALTSLLTVPVFNEDGETVSIELPLRGLEVPKGVLSAQRSCMGKWQAGAGYEPLPGEDYQGRLIAYIDVEDAKAGNVEISEALSVPLCKIVAGLGLIGEGSCDDPRSTWPDPPDSLCDGGGVCTQNASGQTDVCDPLTTCNAWRINAGFAAHGIEITN